MALAVIILPRPTIGPGSLDWLREAARGTVVEACDACTLLEAAAGAALPDRRRMRL